MTFLSVTRGLLYLLIFSLPLFYLPVTVDALEINKQTLLVVLTFAGALTWIGSLLFSKRFFFRHGWLNVFPLLFLTAVGLSAWQSSAPFLSWVGGATQEYTSFLTFAALTVLFFLVVNTLYGKDAHRFVHFILILSALVVAGFSITALVVGNQIFNTIGTVNSAGVYLVAMTVFALSLWISHRKQDSLLYEGVKGKIEQGMIIALSLVTFFYLLVADYGMLWMMFVVGLVIMFAFVIFRSRDFSSTRCFFLPIILLVASVPFWFFLSSPIGISVPSEVTINYSGSNHIAENALKSKDASLGSGPGTYAFVYAREHSLSVNQTEFYSARFDRAFSMYLTLLPTLGYLGFIAFILLIFALFYSAVMFIVRAHSREQWLQAYAAFIPFCILAISAGVYHFNITLTVLFFLFGSLLASQTMPAVHTEKSTTPVARLFTSLALALGALGFLVVIFMTSQRYVAEAAYAKAVRTDRTGENIQEVVALLDRAATLNRFDDRAYRVLAEALLHRVKEQLGTVSAASELTPESRAYVQALVASAVNASVRATELSPASALNWLVRGSVYRELMPVVPNASAFAVSAFENAIEREPLNPSNWNELGITYLAAAERERPLTVAKDESAAQQAKALVQDYMAKGETAFARAIELKANYAPAHYQLSLAYERQGRLDEAIGKMESVARYNLQDVGVAFQLGQLYMRRNGDKDLERAKSSFEYAISLAPGFSNARWFLASIYEQQGNKQAAIEQLKKVLEFNPENQLVRTRLDRLLAPLP